jgi:hypothetical protein
LLLALALAGCSALTPKPAPQEPPSAFLARQYLDRGRAAWNAGNAENARFLIGKSVELDPTNEDAVAQWQSHWPLDSLPPAAAAARAAADSAALATGAADADHGKAEVADAKIAEPETGAEVAAAPDELPLAQARQDSARGATPGEELAGAAPGDVPAEAGGVGGDLPVPAPSAEPPPPPPDPATLARAAEIRSRFEAARSAGERGAMQESGEALIRLQPHYLPDLYRVLSAWISARIDPAATEARVRELLASLEYGDPAFLVGKPLVVLDAVYLRGYRGRFLDLLGWSAFQRGDLAQAEAALRSAETEINLRGRGDVTNLRHLAAFYEHKGDLARAERYAVAAAARDTTGAGEVQAAAARLWTQRRRGNRTGLDSRLAEEAARVRLEERGAAIAGRLYAPVPVFSARRSDGGAHTPQSLRGRVTVLVLWDRTCADCHQLLSDLAAAPLAPAPPGKPGAERAPVEVVALDLGESGGSAAALPQGLVGARPDDPAPLARALGAETLPVTLVVEPAGFIQYRHTGYPADLAARRDWLERVRWQVQSLVSLRPDVPAR